MEKCLTVKETAELAVSLFCQGMRIDSLSSQMRPVVKRRAGLGSGLEIILPNKKKDIWLNVPIEEDFATKSPYLLIEKEEKFYVTGEGVSSLVDFPSTPKWYTKKTSSGRVMSRVGVLQGTSLGIYIGPCCDFWKKSPSLACHFCATGVNVGVYEESKKSLDDIIETVLAGKKESNITFVHLNSGYQKDRDLQMILPFVQALKQEVGILVGVQTIPPPLVEEYIPLLKAGVDHFSLCYEFQNPDYFAKYLPGKAKEIGQKRFFNSLEYLTSHMPKGSVSGEIIAGIEPIESTLEAIDYITSLGAFPTVCIFRPLKKSALENTAPPCKEDMIKVLRYMALSCLRQKIPIGMVPGLEVSLVMTPEDARYLLPRNFEWYLADWKLAIQRFFARLYFAWKGRTKRITKIDFSYI